jgi:hypothetical protein
MTPSENVMRDEHQPLLPPGADTTGGVNASRRRFAKAGLGGSAILVTLASRPVLGATCVSPSAAGSGNHSQHNPVACTPLTVQQWIENVPADHSVKWTGTNYAPNDPFHPLFARGGFLDFYKDATTSYSLWDVLTGNTPSAPVAGPTDLGKWFVAGLLNASDGNYGGVIQTVGPDPSVRGIEDEFAHKGYFEPTAGTKWYADTIKAYLKDPGSVF